MSQSSKIVKGRSDAMRQVWVENQKGLAFVWERSGLGMKRWIRENRELIDTVIDLEMEKRDGGAKI